MKAKVGATDAAIGPISGFSLFFSDLFVQIVRVRMLRKIVYAGKGER